MTDEERKEVARRKKELTRQIQALQEERRLLCLSDKAREQHKEVMYLLLYSPELIAVRVPPGLSPTADAFGAGVTVIMRHYGLLRKDCSSAEYAPDVDIVQKAYAGELNPKTGDRWMVGFELWEWGPKGPFLIAPAARRLLK